MQKLILLLSLFLCLISCNNEKEQLKTNEVIENTNNLLLKTYIRSVINSKNLRPFNGIIVLAKNGNIILQETEGFSDIESNKKITSDSQFTIASLSKQITATLILLEQEKGNLKLNDKIISYLPELDKEKYKEITIHHLLCHTSGIDELDKELQFKPGERFLYSNTGYNLLGKIITKTSGRSYSKNAKELFEKLGMKNSTTAELYTKGNLTEGYDGENGKEIHKIEHHLKHIISDKIGVPAGGIISTANDLVIWNEKLHNGKIISQDSYKLLISSNSKRNHSLWGKIDYGYGIQIAEELPLEYFHGGYVRGFPSLNDYYPETGYSLIVLENIANDSKDFAHIFSYHVLFRDFVRSFQKEMKKEQELNAIESNKKYESVLELKEE
ncbi:MAG: beta-lactamase family protein [Flavobacteriales bacterium]|nr:beta-lactamase family protein [Flavobacteriales bacterium]